jgi:hypothetical protein
MIADEILRQLRHVPNRCDFAPYQTALLAAAAQRDAITPELIAAIDRVSADPAYYLNHRDDCLHVFAIYLLAQFRETRALDSFLRFFSLPGDQALDLSGDMIVENGAAILASVCGGNPAPLLRFACDETVNEFVRGQAIGGLFVQSIRGERPREAVISSLRDLYSTLPRPGNSFVWAELVGTVLDFNAPELLPEARQAYADSLVDEGIIGLEDIEPDAPREPGRLPRPSREQQLQWFCERNAPVDAIEECSGWLCFSDEVETDAAWDDDDENDDDVIDLPRDEPPVYVPPKPYIAPPKTGRNEPCPCGSGKKYKKCCGK